ncbi:Chaperone protein DnaJ [Durusdinium trenchii]|uniref:Chaperone protein DnaJ n=1 Tax=Durusdinium trenchii TaxID=1381693 RepID=A0ABP0MEG6_9DINO
MARASNLLVSAVLFAGAFTVSRWAFVAPNVNTQGLRQSSTALAARGGGEYDISDADIQTELLQLTVDSWLSCPTPKTLLDAAGFHDIDSVQDLHNRSLPPTFAPLRSAENPNSAERTGAGGDPPKGTVLSELVVKFFHGDFTPQGFKRYSGLWSGDIAVGVAKLKEQMSNPMFVTKGGVGYGVDETQKVEDDGKGWVWLAAEMSPGGLAVEKRAILVAKQSNVDELFQKVGHHEKGAKWVNWDTALGNIEKTFGGPQIKQFLAPAPPPHDRAVPQLRLSMARASNLLVSAVLFAGAFTVSRWAFVAPNVNSQGLRQSSTALAARGGGEYDISDADIQNFYNSLLTLGFAASKIVDLLGMTGAGGDPPKGTVLSELVVKFFHGDFTPQGFKRYSGLWSGDIAVGVAKLKEQMSNPMFVTKGGVGYGVDETQKVEDDGKGWVWLAAEMSPGGLAVELFKSVPYGKRAILVAKQSNVDELFQKAIPRRRWDGRNNGCSPWALCPPCHGRWMRSLDMSG